MFSPVPNLTQRTLLAEALQLSRSTLNSATVIDEPERQQRQTRLQQIRDALKTFAHPICQTPLAIETIPLTVRQSFVQAALLVTRYRQIGGSGWQGTIPSHTLSQYQPDPIPEHLASESAIAALCQTFALPDSAEAELKATLETVDRHIATQTQTMRAVMEAAADAITWNGDPTDAYHSPTVPTIQAVLFRHLFGSIPIPSAAIDLIHTEMQLFFCIDYEGDQLRDPALWHQLTDRERSQVQAFLQSLKQFSFEQFQRFPVFGPCTAQRLDYEWCTDVARRCNSSTTTVIQCLMRSVGIIPTQKAEAFLIHDIWGHHWQLMLTQFESDYAILTTCDEPLRAGETAYTSQGPLTCRELFRLAGDRVAIDEPSARLFFNAEVQQRLGLLFTHLIGEMIADVAEFKFVWEHPQSAHQLLSSSLFKLEPTKLDLSLADIDFLFLRVLRPLLEVQLSVFETLPLEMELLADWNRNGDAVESLELCTSLKAAIAHLYQIFLQEYNQTYLPTMAGESGLFTQIVGNLLYLQNAINTLYTDFAVQANVALPFQDLLLIFVGCYCSSDSFTEFWAIDNVLADYFIPCWKQLGLFTSDRKSA